MSEASDIRKKLKALGSRRATLEEREERLSGDVEEALREAYGTISVAEAARLLGVHRTTVYRVYHPHERAA